MNSLKKAVLYGFLIWLIVFVVSFLIFPLKDSNRPLFESIMPVIISINLVIFSGMYFKKVSSKYLKEGVLLGLIWFAVNIMIDLPLFLLKSPMQTTFTGYMSDIGITYLIMPVFTSGIGLILEKKKN